MIDFISSRRDAWKRALGVAGLGMLTLAAVGVEAAEGQGIQLLVRGDDMGVCQAANEACIQA